MRHTILVTATFGLGMFGLSAMPGAVAAPASVTAAPTLSTLFTQAAAAFHRAEPKFQSYSQTDPALSPLAKGDPAIPAYRNAARAAERFLAAQKAPGQGTPIMLYFAAMSYDRLGDHAKTLLYLNRLLNEFPDYKRPRINGDAAFDHAVKTNLLHLKLWHSRQPAVTPETLESLRQLAADAAQIAALRDEQNRRYQKYPDVDRIAPTADMRRVAALPDAVKVALEVHDAALPAIAKSKGAKATRDYLRSLNREPFAAYFADYAGKKLVDLDKVILAGYRNEAGQALKKNQFSAAVAVYRRMLADYAGTPAEAEAATGLRSAQIGGYRYAAQQAFKASDFDKAKANWRKIVAEFPDSAEATAATAELKKIVPVAVTFYRDLGEKNFKPESAAQFGKPQSKAREFYQKMYREEPDGPQADAALLGWGRGLGTESKPKEALAKYQQLITQFPQSDLVPDALFAAAFIEGANFNRNYDKALALVGQLVEKYPQSPKAAEGLWYGAFWRAYGQGNYGAATQLLEQLRQLPESPYHQLIEAELAKYRQLEKTAPGR